MLGRAEITGHCDHLTEAEMVAFLQAADQPWDLIVSADTFCYFGALNDLLAAAGAALAPGGRLVFTVEREDGTPGTGYALHPHGRHAHTRGCVTDGLAGAGLLLEGLDEVVLRTERGEPVHGFVVRAVSGRQTLRPR